MKFKLDHINLTVKNMEESMNWYKNLFNLEFLEGDLNHPTEPWAIIGKDDTMICMYQDPDLKPANSGAGNAHRIYHFGLRTSDKEQWETRLNELGSKVKYGGAYKYPRSVSWYLDDPSGHEIEVSYSGDGPLKFS